MRFLVILSLCLFFTGCLSAHLQDTARPKMPDKYVGYWGPFGDGTANVGLEISEDGRMQYRDDSTGEVHENVRYKVIHVTEKYVYTLSKISPNPAFWAKSGIDDPSTNWRYERYHIRIDDDIDFRYLTKSTEHCDLTQQDWHLSADKHWERLKSGECRDHEGATQFYSRSTRARVIEN